MNWKCTPEQWKLYKEAEMDSYVKDEDGDNQRWYNGVVRSIFGEEPTYEFWICFDAIKNYYKGVVNTIKINIDRETTLIYGIKKAISELVNIYNEKPDSPIIVEKLNLIKECE